VRGFSLTAILYKLKKGQRHMELPVGLVAMHAMPPGRPSHFCNCQVSTIPTLNFNVENCKYNNILFSVWDVGGQDSIRPLWRHYYTGTQGLVYVVDSNDHHRVRKAAEELHKMVLDNEMRFAVLLVFANKIDLPHSMSVEEITRAMRLAEIRDRVWKVQPVCAISGEGLWSGLKWLASNVKAI